MFIVPQELNNPLNNPKPKQPIKESPQTWEVAFEPHCLLTVLLFYRGRMPQVQQLHFDNVPLIDLERQWILKWLQCM